MESNLEIQSTEFSTATPLPLLNLQTIIYKSLDKFSSELICVLYLFLICRLISQSLLLNYFHRNF